MIVNFLSSNEKVDLYTELNIDCNRFKLLQRTTVHSNFNGYL